MNGTSATAACARARGGIRVGTCTEQRQNERVIRIVHSEPQWRRREQERAAGSMGSSTLIKVMLCALTGPMRHLPLVRRLNGSD